LHAILVPDDMLFVGDVILFGYACIYNGRFWFVWDDRCAVTLSIPLKGWKAFLNMCDGPMGKHDI
jgi:hypothetical protein